MNAPAKILLNLFLIFPACATLLRSEDGSMNQQIPAAPRQQPGIVTPPTSQKSTAPSAQSRLSSSETGRLEDFIAEALRDNREIRAAQKRYEASLERRSISSSLPDPRLSISSANVGNQIGRAHV